MPPQSPPRPKYDPRAHGCLCDHCPLRDEDPVPPKGPSDALLVVVGEAPGGWEVKKGEPFVGPAGNQLNDIFYYSGWKREQVWLTNTVLCRPIVPNEEGKKKYDFKRYIAWIRKENIRLKKEAVLRGEPFQPIASPVDCCAPRLWGELGHFEQVAMQRGQPNGAVVMPVGNFACEAVLGRSGIMKLRGSPFQIDINDPHKR